MHVLLLAFLFVCSPLVAMNSPVSVKSRSKLPHFYTQGRTLCNRGTAYAYDQVEYVEPGCYQIFDLAEQRKLCEAATPWTALLGPIGVSHIAHIFNYPKNARLFDGLRATLAVVATDGNKLVVHHMSASTPPSCIAKMIAAQLIDASKKVIAVRIFAIDDHDEVDKQLFKNVARTGPFQLVKAVKDSMCTQLAIQRDQVFAQVYTVESNMAVEERNCIKFIAIPLSDPRMDSGKYKQTIRFCSTDPFEEHMFYGFDARINQHIFNLVVYQIACDQNEKSDAEITPAQNRYLTREFVLGEGVGSLLRKKIKVVGQEDPQPAGPFSKWFKN